MLLWLLGKRYKKRRFKLDCGLFYLKDQDKVIETKLRFCVKEKCVKDIKGNLHNIRDMQKSMEIHQNESIILTGGQETTLIKRVYYYLTHYSI